jgi:hypothetical protein
MTTLLVLAVLALIWIGLRDSRRPRIAPFNDTPHTGKVFVRHGDGVSSGSR